MVCPLAAIATKFLKTAGERKRNVKDNWPINIVLLSSDTWPVYPDHNQAAQECNLTFISYISLDLKAQVVNVWRGSVTFVSLGSNF